MKKALAVVIVMFVFMSGFSASAYEDTPVNIAVNGNSVYFKEKPFIRDGVTYVSAKEISQKLNLTYEFFSALNSVVVSSSNSSICFTMSNEYATVSDIFGVSNTEFVFRKLAAPPVYVGNSFYVPVRDVASVFGYTLSFNKEKQTVYFGYSPEAISEETLLKANSLSYYFQNQAEFNLPSFGSGYCWTCSYAMLISNLTGNRVTPNDVAWVNISQGADGAYCYHSEIASTFGFRFVSALPEGSSYFAGRDSTSGGTYINNPMNDDNVVRAALREALTLHPEGVIVRYAGYPHSMVAVAYEGDIILFNDPAPSGSHTYSDTGKYQAVPFFKTCVGMKGFRLSDITFIQAID